MDRLEVLKAQMANYEMQYSQGHLSLIDSDKYFAVCEEYNFLHGLKILLDIAPETMNPRRISEHCERVRKYLIRYCPDKRDKISKFANAMEKYYLNFNPKNIEDYKSSITFFIANAIKIYKE